MTKRQILQSLLTPTPYLQAVMGNMDSISNFSNDISVNLSDSRQKITKLSSVHNLLTKLQTLFELPTLLRKAIQMGAYPQVSYRKRG